MKCPRCGHETEKNWTYCPKCGTRIERGFSLFGFDKIFESFERMQKQMHEEMKNFDRNFEVFDLRPAFKEAGPKGKVSGFTIKISRLGNSEPKVSVHTFGDVNGNAIKKEVNELTGEQGTKLKQMRQPEIKNEPALPMPRHTEEPRTSIRRLESKFVVEIELPGVKSERNIRINELENSVEVRAVADDKAYFKILTKPAEYGITGKKFDKGKLVIEFS